MATQQTFEFLAPAATTTLPDRRKSRSVDSPSSREEILRQLRRKLNPHDRLSTDQEKSTWSTGCAVLDSWLPQGGLRCDAVTEWISGRFSQGAMSLSLIAAANRLRTDESNSDDAHSAAGPLLMISPRSGIENLDAALSAQGMGTNHRSRRVHARTRGTSVGRRTPVGTRVRPESFFPPAAVALGIPAQRMVWVRPSSHADLVWSVDQALRCRAVAAVWAWIDHDLDDRDARRFQLAAEAGRTPGLFVRPAKARHQPGFADVRWHVENASTATWPEASATGTVARTSNQRLFQVTLDRARAVEGGKAGSSQWVRIDDRGMLQVVTDAEWMTDSGSKPLELDKPRDRANLVRLASELAHPKSSKRDRDRRSA